MPINAPVELSSIAFIAALDISSWIQYIMSKDKRDIESHLSLLSIEQTMKYINFYNVYSCTALVTSNVVLLAKLYADGNSKPTFISVRAPFAFTSFLFSMCFSFHSFSSFLFRFDDRTKFIYFSKVSFTLFYRLIVAMYVTIT